MFPTAAQVKEKALAAATELERSREAGEWKRSRSGSRMGAGVCAKEGECSRLEAN